MARNAKFAACRDTQHGFEMQAQQSLSLNVVRPDEGTDILRA
jgi:hypothetical protein